MVLWTLWRNRWVGWQARPLSDTEHPAYLLVTSGLRTNMLPWNDQTFRGGKEEYSRLYKVSLPM
jgi:hypothetical protein